MSQLLSRKVPGYRSLLVVSGLCLMVLAAVCVALPDQTAAVLAGLGQVSGVVVFAALSLSLVNYSLRFLRWTFLIRLMHGKSAAPIPHGRAMLIYLAGFSLTTTPGKIGELVRQRWLTEHAVPLRVTVAVFGLERMLDCIALLIIAAVAGPWAFNPDWLDTVGVATLLLVAGAVIVVRLLRGTGVIERLMSRLRVDARHSERLSQLQHILTAVPPRKLMLGLALCLGVGVVAWAAEGVALWLILEDVSPATQDFDSVLVVSSYAASLIAGAASMLPAGLGAAEATLSALLMICGATGSAALISTIAGRAATLWFAVLLGLVAVLVLEAQAWVPAWQRGRGGANSDATGRRSAVSSMEHLVFHERHSDLHGQAAGVVQHDA